jgi:hypothetical protein
MMALNPSIRFILIFRLDSIVFESKRGGGDDCEEAMFGGGGDPGGACGESFG